MYVLFDVGATKTRVGIADIIGGILDSVIIPTPSDYHAGLAAIENAVSCRLNDFDTARLSRAGSIDAVVGGVAGVFDRNHEALLGGGNIKNWAGKPIKKMLTDMFRAPVILENDAALAGLGEAVVGAGKSYDIVGYITVSTGIGGARITRKTIDAHVFGFEPGHQIIEMNRSLCSVCMHKTIESHIGGRGLEKHYGRKGEEMHDAAAWEDITRSLAIGLVNTIVHWSPEILVLGGSMMQSISLERLRECIKERLTVYPELPLIEGAALGDLGGLEGALHIARMNHNTN